MDNMDATDDIKVELNDDIYDDISQVSIEDARHGLFKVIKYLEELSPDAYVYVQMLLQVLDFINTCHGTNVNKNDAPNQTMEYSDEATRETDEQLPSSDGSFVLSAAGFAVEHPSGDTESLMLDQCSTADNLLCSPRHTGENFQLSIAQNLRDSVKNVTMGNKATMNKIRQGNRQRKCKNNKNEKLISDFHTSDAVVMKTVEVSKDSHNEGGTDQVKVNIAQVDQLTCDVGDQLTCDVGDQLTCDVGDQLTCDVGKQSFQDSTELQQHHFQEHKERDLDHQCNICGKTLENTDELNQHSKKHKGQRFSCAHCDKSYSREYSLKRHIRSHTDEQLHKCYDCDQIFKSKLDLKEHIERIHEPNVSSAQEVGQLCDNGVSTSLMPINEMPVKQDKKAVKVKRKQKIQGRPTKRKVALKETKKSSDKPVGYTCTICNKRLQEPLTLQKHFQKHKGQEHNYCCVVCEDKFETSDDLHKHLLTHKPFTCDLCGTGFVRLSHKRVHKLTHLTEEEKSFVCDVCGKRFNRSLRLAEHKMIHTGERPFPCTECDQSFKNKKDLKDHVHRHTNQHPYPCDQCDKKFQTYSGYWAHHRIKHQGIIDKSRNFICSYCGNAFINEYHLRHHEYTHTDTREVRCKLCDKGFIWKSQLKGHMIRKHKEKAPRMFNCDSCEKTFVDKGQLKNHQLTHTGEKPFSCRICDKKFSKQTNMKRHEITHTGAKPYVCTVCGQGFTQSTSLKIHVNRVHQKTTKQDSSTTSVHSSGKVNESNTVVEGLPVVWSSFDIDDVGCSLKETE